MIIKKKVKLIISVALFSFSSVAFSDNNISVVEFAKAHKTVMEIQEKNLPKIKAAKTQKDKEDLQVQNQLELIKVIEESEITIEEYNRMISDYQDDTELKKEVNEVLKNIK